MSSYYYHAETSKFDHVVPQRSFDGVTYRAMMEVKLFANLAELAGERSIGIDPAEASTLEEALDQLFEQAPDLRDEIIEDGEPCDHINILVDGTNVMHADDGMQLSLSDDAEIAIFPPVSGG